jgi:hypothetical protein
MELSGGGLENRYLYGELAGLSAELHASRPSPLVQIRPAQPKLLFFKNFREPCNHPNWWLVR